MRCFQVISNSHSGGWRALFERGLFNLAVCVSLVSCAPRDDTMPSADRNAARPRVLSLVPSINELILAIGAGSHLIGRTDFDEDPRLLDLHSVGGGIDPSLERIAELRPDLMFVFAGRDAPARLEELGVVVYSTSPQSLDDIRALIDSLGLWLDRTDAADSLRRRLDSTLAAVANAVKGRERRSTIYVVWHDPPMVAGPGTYVDELITIAGGVNVFGDASQQWPTVGMESIVERQPDIVLWPRGGTASLELDEIRRLPGWRDLRAVQMGGVAFVNANLFNRPGPGVIDAAMVLVEILHPDALSRDH